MPLITHIGTCGGIFLFQMGEECAGDRHHGYDAVSEGGAGINIKEVIDAEFLG